MFERGGHEVEKSLGEAKWISNQMEGKKKRFGSYRGWGRESLADPHPQRNSKQGLLRESERTELGKALI